MQFMLGGFSDTFTDAAANEAACAFIRGKIAATVRDPEKARRVMPTERFFARRPLCEEGLLRDAESGECARCGAGGDAD